ncbi:CoA-binding protein [Hymenobacter psoromatis]|nr:CoA-binding protein [Hymenobacter psoromatis]
MLQQAQHDVLLNSFLMKTLVLGATDNPDRYAYKAVHSLKNHGHEVVPVGIRKGRVAGQAIHTDRPQEADIDTVTLYVGPQNQPNWYEYILSLKPRRIIFNPGTENPELEQKAQAQGIMTEEACTLVMLSVGQYEK